VAAADVSAAAPPTTVARPTRSFVGRAASAQSATGEGAPSSETPLARELRALDSARSALARGDAAGALAELDRHDRAFPTGPLRTEAAVLRAEALVAHGETARAKRIAQDLLARDPNGPFARRLKTIADAP
jgi:hypothetical protein